MNNDKPFEFVGRTALIPSKSKGHGFREEQLPLENLAHVELTVETKPNAPVEECYELDMHHRIDAILMLKLYQRRQPHWNLLGIYAT